MYNNQQQFETAIFSIRWNSIGISNHILGCSNDFMRFVYEIYEKNLFNPDTSYTVFASWMQQRERSFYRKSTNISQYRTYKRICKGYSREQVPSGRIRAGSCHQQSALYECRQWISYFGRYEARCGWYPEVRWEWTIHCGDNAESFLNGWRQRNIRYQEHILSAIWSVVRELSARARRWRRSLSGKQLYGVSDTIWCKRSGNSWDWTEPGVRSPRRFSDQRRLPSADGSCNFTLFNGRQSGLEDRKRCIFFKFHIWLG